MKIEKSFGVNSSKIYLKYGYLMYPVIMEIEPKIQIGEDVFYAKKSFHVSLLCLEKLSKREQLKILEFSQKYPIKLTHVSTAFRLVTKDDLKSIIIRVTMTGLKRIIKEINKNFGFKFEYPPTHITLYTLKGQFGIPINTIVEFISFSRKLEIN